MLGIESEISIQAQVSRLSISSNPSRETKDKNASAHNSSTLHSEGILSANSSNNHKNEKIKLLRNRMHNISRNQEMMEQRMKGYVGMIEKELKKKEEQNRQLENLISSLQGELSESRADLEVLTTYVTKKISAPSREEYRGIANTSTAARHPEQPQPKRTQAIQPKPAKSISPKHKVIVLDKSKNLSPVSREQKKFNTSGSTIAAFHKKVKSPGK